MKKAWNIDFSQYKKPMTKTQKKVWDMAVDVWGTEHDPYNTNTLRNVYYGWHNYSGYDVHGWHAEKTVAFGDGTVFMGANLSEVKVWHQDMMSQKEAEQWVFDA